MSNRKAPGSVSSLYGYKLTVAMACFEFPSQISFSPHGNHLVGLVPGEDRFYVYELSLMIRRTFDLKCLRKVLMGFVLKATPLKLDTSVSVILNQQR